MTRAQATTILRQEHDAILRMLVLSEEAARKLDRGERCDPEILTGLNEFFRLFADRCYHSKEEELLFPLLEKKGLPREGGPISVMLFEHDEGRALIQQMLRSAEAYASGGVEAGPRWAAAALSYTWLLHEHIFKENNVLFMLAERALTDTEQQELAAAFDRIEEEKMGPGTHERLHALMEKLAQEISQPWAAGEGVEVKK